MEKLFNKLFSSEGKKTTTSARPKMDDSLLEMGPKKIDLKSTSRRLTPINKAPSDNIYDSLAFVIFCPQHKKMAVCSTEHTGGTSAVWLPFIYLSSTLGWNEAINDGLALILSDNDNEILNKLKSEHPWDVCILHLLRTQLPHTLRYITRLICLARLHSKSKSLVCCRKTSRISWIYFDQIKNVENLWAQEVKACSKKVYSDMTDPEIYQIVVEHDLDWALKYVPRDPPRNEEEDMLRHLGINEKHIERVLIDFLEHCFPAYLMTFHSFKNYFSKYGFNYEDNRMAKYFTAFNFSGSGYLNFHELLLGMACVEPDVYNGSSRVKFIFRFYDMDRDGLLNQNDFIPLVKDLNPGMAENLVIEKVKENMRVMKATANGVAFQEFSTSIGTRKFRGTSGLCRANRSLFYSISNAMITKGIKANPELKKTVTEYVNKKIYEGVCDNCRKTTYKLATHVVTLGIDGKYVDCKEITECKH